MRQGRHDGGRIVEGTIKGAIAGAAAAWVMDRVTWAMYDSADRSSESAEAHRREKEAQVEGRAAPQAMVAKAARLAGREPSEEQIYRAGQALHYMMGIVPGAVYGALGERVPAIRAGRGMLYGLALFLTADEGMLPLIGVASRPTKYPLETHWRGLVGHVVVGAMTDAVLGALDEATDFLRERQERDDRSEAPELGLPIRREDRVRGEMADVW